jgi:zinc transport system permease protein
MFLINWLDAAIDFLAGLAPAESLLSLPATVRGLIAVILVCLICGAVGSLVVGNRMAFFSDALAHCAFAGVAIGLLTALVTGAVKRGPFYEWGVPAIMVGFGILVGLAIAFVKEQTALASDTVIGVFFAGAIGFGAMLFKALNARTFMTPESFIFGDPMYVSTEYLLALVLLTLLTLGLLCWIHNQYVFTSFNTSLARSRRMSMRLFNYVFIVLLAVIVNLSLRTVGALLINALLIVPAATAGNLSRNLRQMFWLSMALSLTVGIVGPWLSEEIGIPDVAGGETIHFSWGGTIVVLSVLLFFASMLIGPWIRGKQTA